MELDAIDAAGVDHRGVGQRVSACRRSGVDHRRIKAMREVDVLAAIEVTEKLRFAPGFDFVPAHVWDAHLVPCEATNDAVVNAESRQLRSFFARCKKRLEPEANAEKRYTRPDAF